MVLIGAFNDFEAFVLKWLHPIVRVPGGTSSRSNVYLAENGLDEPVFTDCHIKKIIP